MASFPSTTQLQQWQKTLGTIHVDTNEQAHALEQARHLMQSLARSPEVARQLGQELAAACEVLTQGARERTIAVIAGRLREVNNQVMDRFDQGRANRNLLRAYLSFAEMTHAAMEVAPINPLADADEQSRQSQARIDAFNQAEATVANVRQALKQPLGQLTPRSELREVARDYLETEKQPFVEHLAAAIAATKQARMREASRPTRAATARPR